MNRLYLLLTTLIALVLITTVTGCSSKSPIKLGMVTTLTGLSSSIGGNARDAAILAIEEANREGGINGRQIELIVKDDRADPEAALVACRELIDEGVAAILGPYLSTVTLKVVPLVNQKEILMLCSGSSSPELTGLDDNLLRLVVPTDHKAPYLAEAAFNRYNIDKIAIVYDLSNPKYTISLSERFSEQYRALGGEVVKVLTYRSHDNFSAPLITEEIAASGAKGLFIISNAIEAALLCQHIRTQLLDLKIISSEWAFPDPNFILYGGQTVEGVATISDFDIESTAPAFLDYKKRYESRYGKMIGQGDKVIYEATGFLIQALRKRGRKDSLKQLLLEELTLSGIDGQPVRFDAYGDPVRTVYISEIKEGRIRTIAEIPPEK